MNELLPPCTNACPVNTDVRGYLAAIARRDYAEAYRLIRANNPFPTVCAWVCPHPCEDACRRAGVDAPLSIRDLKRFAVEAAGAVREETARARDTGKRVAVVGAGPAGLTAAYDLVRLGHQTVVYERHSAPGGHFWASLPTYRLPREMLNRDVAEILAAGVELRTGVEVGEDITVEQLRNQYDAVIISTGLWNSRGLPLPGFDHPRVLPALPFLKTANTGGRPDIGGEVIVIGGGDVAMDVARTALRLGVAGVRAVCLEPRHQMPAHLWEIEDALAEGVALMPGYGPVEALVEGGGITGLKVQKVKSVFDRDGRFNPVFEPGTFETVPGDTIILAIGQAPDNSFLAGSGLTADARGCLAVDKETLAAGAGGVFACGEIASGPGPAIAAVASGHRAAAVVERYLKDGRIIRAKKEIEVIGSLPAGVAELVPRRGRREMPVLSPEERKNNFLPYELGLDERAALCEAGRCLSCGLGAVVIAEKCTACLTCQRVCPYGVPLVEGRARMPVEGCQACGICAAACPAGAITIGVLDEGAVLAQLDTSLLKEKVAVFTCREACLDCYSPEGLKKDYATDRVSIVELPTVGALRLEWLMRAFENGAAGVAVIACRAGRCRHAGGAVPLEGLMARAGELLESIGVPRGWLQYFQPGGEEDPAELLSGFARRLQQVE